MIHQTLSKEILKTTPQYIEILKKANIHTIKDFLQYYPKEYEWRENAVDSFFHLSFHPTQGKNVIRVKLLTIEKQKTSQKMLLIKAYIEDINGIVAECIWFNQTYLFEKLSKYKQKHLYVIGNAKYEYGKLVFVSPTIEYETYEKVVPIYKSIHTISSQWIASKMKLVRGYIPLLKETLPSYILEKYHFPSYKDAVETIHFPKDKESLYQAKKRLAYEELYHIHYQGILQKYEYQKISHEKTCSIPMNVERIKQILAKLPYTLTNSQKIALFEIIKDMEKPYSMNRLLQGDVGTGKTIIAGIVLVHAILQGKYLGTPLQGAIMAPTEILARQHEQSLQYIFHEFGIKSHLLVGSIPQKQKKIIKSHLASGNIDVIIGTHALLEEDVCFENLAIVIIDEQHRFGVKQREILELGTKNASGNIPHTLHMSATPIPRSLALTLYGEKDISLLNEYPQGKKTVFTKIIKTPEERKQIEQFIKHELQKGRQVFWISPLIEESEKIDLTNAIERYHYLKEVFAPFTVALLHGKMTAKEKDQIMQEFYNNTIHILSSTSVVEVGIHVPNATIMCIEGAERFGLSQLHQFRGRVGRGTHQSYCYLFPTKPASYERLKIFEKTNDGFVLSQEDLKMRGPGEVYGVKQSGMPELTIATFEDLEQVPEIREDIMVVLSKHAL